ncbi:opacity protein-like surface antigen [Paucibacter oligotrophus]|uniref:Opacity protein-like surface antigen n=1 Tax=Roseateles oligotrophus TaxID=1769250 RepID=A0A840L745_9BURK|nr:outer membrane beta-barrel protein [Roseateles oligotrophus]MBB4842512.1 opacity protein-like surface antigen [Roseateles oligotrophus]
MSVKSSFKKHALALCLLACAASAWAAEPKDAGGIYLGASLGRASGSASEYKTGTSLSLGFGAGYRFNENFAVEAFSRSLSFELLANALNNNPGYYPEDHLGLALLAGLPVNDSFSVYARLGTGRTRMSTGTTIKPDYKLSETSAGLGLAYAFTPRFAGKLEYLRFTRNEVNLLTFGLEYRF